MYIWAERNWPHFVWDEPVLRPALDAVGLLRGRVLGKTEATYGQAKLDVEMDALIQNNAIRATEIEGDFRDVGSVRSSVASQLGLEQVGISTKTTHETEALVALLLQSTHQLDEPLSLRRRCLWQSMLLCMAPSC